MDAYMFKSRLVFPTPTLEFLDIYFLDRHLVANIFHYTSCPAYHTRTVKSCFLLMLNSTDLCT